jgi:hypothetical protein
VKDEGGEGGRKEQREEKEGKVPISKTQKIFLKHQRSLSHQIKDKTFSTIKDTNYTFKRSVAVWKPHLHVYNRRNSPEWHQKNSAAWLGQGVDSERAATKNQETQEYTQARMQGAASLVGSTEPVNLNDLKN